ncbi:MAG: hypothetical protein U9N36_00435 [Euryarchaeota archaeon]|nr:hypothetical protein [Euryarchaeota archaeon]
MIASLGAARSPFPVRSHVFSRRICCHVAAKAYSVFAIDDVKYPAKTISAG